MKTLYIFLITAAVIAGTAATSDARDKRETRQDRFRETAELVESGEFIFIARRAHPQAGRSIDLTTHDAVLEISGNTGEARLPFFGRAFTVPYGGRGGIRFSGEIENEEITRNEDRMRIRYSFELRDHDYYKVIMNIGYDGNATVDVISSNRSQISYQGRISGISGS
jgi:hypothetical protein